MSLADFRRALATADAIAAIDDLLGPVRGGHPSRAARATQFVKPAVKRRRRKAGKAQRQARTRQR